MVTLSLHGYPDLPSARLNVYKVPLTLMRCKANAGGALKGAQALEDGVSFSTGWTVKTTEKWSPKLLFLLLSAAHSCTAAAMLCD